MTGLNLRNAVRIIYILNVCSLISSQDIFFEGGTTVLDKCNTTSGLIGNCKYVEDCPQLKGKNGDRGQKICGFTSNLRPLICCPTTASTTGVLIPKIGFDCGKQGDIDVNHISTVFSRKRRNAKGGFFHRVVVGGKKSKRYSWPWMVLLGLWSDKTKPKFFCSGVLINERFILTAAHCLLTVTNDEFYLRLREYDYKEGFDGSFPEDIAVEDVILHPKYEWITGYDDLAIVKMANDVMITDSARPVCLPWNENLTKNLVDKVAIVTGWGETQYGGSSSSVLQEVEVTVFNSSNCEQWYSEVQDFRKSYPKGLTVDNIICAGDSEGRKDACRGDSGAPLVFYQSSVDRYQLAGIVAGGYGCGKKGYPGLYTSVWNEFNLQWIKDVAFIMDKIF